MASIQVGDRAPEFTLASQTGQRVSLADFRGNKAVVLFFYPKDGTPGCTIQAIGFSDREDEFKKLDLERARKALTHPILFDGRNLFDPAEMEQLGFIYKSIGR